MRNRANVRTQIASFNERNRSVRNARGFWYRAKVKIGWKVMCRKQKLKDIKSHTEKFFSLFLIKIWFDLSTLWHLFEILLNLFGNFRYTIQSHVFSCAMPLEPIMMLKHSLALYLVSCFVFFCCAIKNWFMLTNKLTENTKTVDC